MVKNTKLFFIAFLLFSMGCYNREIKNNNTLNKEIINDSAPLYDYFYKDIKSKEVGLEISNIEKSTDSINIRLWLFIGTNADYFIFDIKYHRANWRCDIIKYNVVDTSKDLIYNKTETRSAIPLQGWELFIKDLYKLEVDRASSSGKLGLDGTLMIIEYKTRNQYLFYKDILSKSEKINAIYNLLVSNFNIQ